MSSLRSRSTAMLEVVILFVLLRLGLVYWGLPLLGLDHRTWPGRFVVYASFVAAPLALTRLRRADKEGYGLSTNDHATQTRTAASLFVPFALYFFVVGGPLVPRLLPVGTGRWPQEIVGMALSVGLLLWCSRILAGRERPSSAPTDSAGASLAALAFMPLAGSVAAMALGERLTGFIFYSCFLGPGEEILFRGYMQSRLNEAFGRPYRLLGAHRGWGLVIATGLFGLMHALNAFDPGTGRYELDWAWAAGATAAGLVFAYLRERTGSVIAPSLLHGLPQAIAALFMRF